jgi:hypothetical protein
VSTQHETVVSHADVQYWNSPEREVSTGSDLFDADYEVARANLDQMYAHNGRNDELAFRLASVVRAERSRRNAHYYRYRALFRVATDQPLFMEQANIPEACLLDIHSRVTAMTTPERSFASEMGGKGIPLELGHVDQLGDWNSGRVLDEGIRKLPESKTLADAGFVFGETYMAKDSAKIDYDFKITEAYRARPGGRDRSVSLKGVRKRAAADIVTEDGTPIELVKKSSFMIDVHSLDQEALSLLSPVMRSIHDNHSPAFDAAAQRAGEAIIEPYIIDPSMRERSTAVIAASSLYFALHRHR